MKFTLMNYIIYIDIIFVNDIVIDSNNFRLGRYTGKDIGSMLLIQLHDIKRENLHKYKFMNINNYEYKTKPQLISLNLTIT